MDTLPVSIGWFRRSLLYAPHVFFLIGLLAWLLQVHLRSQAWQRPTRFAESKLGRGLSTVLAITIGAYGLLLTGDPQAGWLGYSLIASCGLFLVGRGLHFLPDRAYYVPFLIAGLGFFFGR
jgi:hypothetical protein